MKYATYCRCFSVLLLVLSLLGCDSSYLSSIDIPSDSETSLDPGAGSDPDEGSEPEEGSDPDPIIVIVEPPSAIINASMSIEAIKTLSFSWQDVSDATYYRLLENTDGASGFIQIGDDIDVGEQSVEIIVPLHKRVNAQYIVAACNSGGCTYSNNLPIDSTLLTDAIGYVKPSNTGANDLFGFSLAISGDGSTLAVGAYGDDSNSTGINSTSNDDGTASDSGAVYVFMQSDGAWSQQAYIKASNTDAGDLFGTSVALSYDGSTLVVGAVGEASNASGIDGDQTDNSLSVSGAGAAYVYERTGSDWSQTSYLKASTSHNAQRFGESLSLSRDGATLAVGANFESSNSTGINSAYNNDGNADDSGAVYVYVKSAGVWSQQAYIKASSVAANDFFGASVALSDDGDTLAVASSGVDTNTGVVYIFSRTVTVWSQQADIKASNLDVSDNFGYRLSLSADGNTLAVGAPVESSGDANDETDNSLIGAGAVYVFNRTGTVWSQQAYLKASNLNSYNFFGTSVSLDAEGVTLAIGAIYESSNSTGLSDTASVDTSAASSGAVYLFALESGNWNQTAYIKASNTGSGDWFGINLSLTDSGDTLAVGAHNESSNAIVIGGDQTDNTASKAGAVYLY